MVFSVSDGKLTASEAITITVSRAVAQTGRISGVVTASADGQPISGATVSDGTRSAMSSATGAYAVANVPPGTYSVVCSAVGYYPQSKTVTVSAGQRARRTSVCSRIAGGRSMWVVGLSFSIGGGPGDRTNERDQPGAGRGRRALG